MLKDNAPPHKKLGLYGAQMQPNIPTRLRSYLDVHLQVFFSSLGRLTRTPAPFIMTLLVLAISMALSCSFYLMVKNFQQLTGNIESSNQISLFLKPDVSSTTVQRLRERLADDAQVKSVQLITPDEAMAEFKANSVFGEALEAFQQNPLPNVLLVQPKNALEEEAAMRDLVSRFEKLPEVEFAKSDLQWINRLRGILAVANRAVTLLSLLFGMAVLLIIGNTIRLELHDRQQEVFITQLVGATHAFIRRPFLYTGFWLGFLSSIAAWFIVTVSLLILRGPVLDLSAQYAGHFELVFLDYSETFTLIGVASFLGVLGAWLVLGHQINNLEAD